MVLVHRQCFLDLLQDDIDFDKTRRERERTCARTHSTRKPKPRGVMRYFDRGVILQTTKNEDVHQSLGPPCTLSEENPTTRHLLLVVCFVRGGLLFRAHACCRGQISHSFTAFAAAWRNFALGRLSISQLAGEVTWRNF